MAIAIQPKYPVPSRARIAVCFSKDDDGVIDIGWCEGVSGDGRVFRGEMWAQDRVSMLTFFFSVIRLEDLDRAAAPSLVEREGLVSFRPAGPANCDARVFVDDAGHRLWSVNIVVGSEDEAYIDRSVNFFRYSRTEPNTVFRP